MTKPGVVPMLMCGQDGWGQTPNAVRVILMDADVIQVRWDWRLK